MKTSKKIYLLVNLEKDFDFNQEFAQVAVRWSIKSLSGVFSSKKTALEWLVAYQKDSKDSYNYALLVTDNLCPGTVNGIVKIIH